MCIRDRSSPSRRPSSGNAGGTRRARAWLGRGRATPLAPPQPSRAGGCQQRRDARGDPTSRA
eukprot:6909103-Lingulodinium_polyedra.AAC.1